MNFLTMMAYLIVVITLITMIFGIIAYTVYKMREAKRSKMKQNNEIKQSERENEPKKQYLFFEQKELVL